VALVNDAKLLARGGERRPRGARRRVLRAWRDGRAEGVAERLVGAQQRSGDRSLPERERLFDLDLRREAVGRVESVGSPRFVRTAESA
jgi:hypothetical protein